MSFEYKTIAAPEKGKRGRGLHGAAARVAAAFDEILEAEAVDGWEYMRTDVLPVTERSGWLARPRQMQLAVMVFRRPVEAAARIDDDLALRRAPAAEPALRAAGVRSEPEVAIDPDLRLADTVRGPGRGPGRGPDERDEQG
jgi:hypothetical protein